MSHHFPSDLLVCGHPDPSLHRVNNSSRESPSDSLPDVLINRKGEHVPNPVCNETAPAEDRFVCFT